MKIKLKCCCGGEIDAESDFAADVSQAVQRWQDKHKECKPAQTAPPVVYPQAPWPPAYPGLPFVVTCGDNSAGASQ